MGSCDEIGSRIKILRIKLGMTQDELAKLLLVSRGLVNQWERGGRDLKAGTIVALAKALHTSCDFLLTGIDTPNIDVCELTSLTQDSIDALTAYVDGKKAATDRDQNIIFSANLYMINAVVQDKELISELTYAVSDVIRSKVFKEGFEHIRSHGKDEKQNVRAGQFSAGLAIAKFFEIIVNDPKYLALFRDAYSEELNMFSDVYVENDFDLEENQANDDGM